MPQPPEPAPPVLSLHSRVSTGEVGNPLIEAAFARLAPAVPLHTLDTVQWTGPGNHPRRTGPLLGEDLLPMLEVLLDPPDRNGAGCTRLLAGYLPAPGLVADLARLLETRPPLQTFILDPVMGDHGRLYIDRKAAIAIGQSLLPRAHYLLPNFTEALFLATASAEFSGGQDRMLRLIAEELAGRAPELRGLLVTGVPLRSGPRPELGVAIWERGRPPGDLVLLHTPQHEGHFYGTGDLFTGIFSARLLVGDTLMQAAEAARDGVKRAIEQVIAGQTRRLREGFLLSAKPGT